MAWKLKVDEAGTPVVQEGIPVFVDDTGKEAPIDPNQMHQKILELNAESKSRREKLEELGRRLKPVEGIEDVAAFMENATKALETVKNLDDASLVQAGDVERIKSDAKRGMEEVERRLKEQLRAREAELQKELQVRDGHIRKLLISSQFAQHDLFSGTSPRTHIPPDVAESYFGKHFDVDDSGGNLRVIAKDTNGQVITSREPGQFAEPASFAEAMELIFAAYPNKDKLLRAGPGGSGAGGGAEGVPAKTPLAVIKQKLAKATEARDVTQMLRLKTQLAELQSQRA
jgi:hypothetical protein